MYSLVLQQVNQDTGKWAHRLIAIKAIRDKLKNNPKIYIIKHSYTTKKKKSINQNIDLINIK